MVIVKVPEIDKVMIQNDFLMNYGKRIAQIRKLRGITQVKLAELMHVEQPTVQRWESGKRDPGVGTMYDLAKVLGVDACDFFMDDTQVPLGPKLFVKGSALTGQWVNNWQWPEQEWRSFTGRADEASDVSMRFGLRLDGDGFDLIYPPGTILEFRAHFGNADIPAGKKILIVREREDGMFEASVRELAIDAQGTRYAIARSSNPSYMPIKVDQDEPGIVETVIAAVAIQSVKPE